MLCQLLSQCNHCGERAAIRSLLDHHEIRHPDESQHQNKELRFVTKAHKRSNCTPQSTKETDEAIEQIMSGQHYLLHPLIALRRPRRAFDLLCISSSTGHVHSFGVAVHRKWTGPFRGRWWVLSCSLRFWRVVVRVDLGANW